MRYDLYIYVVRRQRVKVQYSVWHSLTLYKGSQARMTFVHLRSDTDSVKPKYWEKACHSVIFFTAMDWPELICSRRNMFKYSYTHTHTHIEQTLNSHSQDTTVYKLCASIFEQICSYFLLVEPNTSIEVLVQKCRQLFASHGYVIQVMSVFQRI